MSLRATDGVYLEIKPLEMVLVTTETMGVGLLVAALLLAGGAMWGLLPLPSMVGAIVLGLSGGVMVASARPKAHLE